MDRLTEIYPSNYYSFVEQKESIVFRIKNFLDKRLFKKLLDQNKSTSLNVLDIGGGTGWLLDMIRSIDPRVNFTQVVDIDDKAAAKAREKGHAYFEGRVEEFETEKQFDLVLLLNLIEHVHDPGAVLKKISNLLSDTGIVLIKTPNIDSWDAHLFRHSNWGGYHCPRHWVLFSRNSFEKLITGTDLHIDSIKFTQGAPFWALSVLSWLTKNRLATITADKPAYRHPLYSPLCGIFAGFDMITSFFRTPSQMFIILSKKS